MGTLWIHLKTFNPILSKGKGVQDCQSIRIRQVKGGMISDVPTLN